MNIEQLEKRFKGIGARFSFRHFPSRVIREGNFAVNVTRDGIFEVSCREDKEVDVEVLDSESGSRHALLMVRDGEFKDKFLCGYDERGWFVAALPKAGVRDIKTAKQALKPVEVVEAERKAKVRGKSRHKRKNKARVRQGEWFFLAMPKLQVDESLILKNEPIQRGGGNPHIAEECYRVGGEEVYVNRKFPNGVTQSEYDRLIREHRNDHEYRNWRKMVRDAKVYVRGKVKHSDHATIDLQEWHRVIPNTETKARSMRHVAFLD